METQQTFSPQSELLLQFGCKLMAERLSYIMCTLKWPSIGSQTVLYEILIECFLIHTNHFFLVL